MKRFPLLHCYESVGLGVSPKPFLSGPAIVVFFSSPQQSSSAPPRYHTVGPGPNGSLFPFLLYGFCNSSCVTSILQVQLRNFRQTTVLYEFSTLWCLYPYCFFAFILFGPAPSPLDATRNYCSLPLRSSRSVYFSGYAFLPPFLSLCYVRSLSKR